MPNTRMSGGRFHSPDPAGDLESLKSYAKAMFSGDNFAEGIAFGRVAGRNAAAERPTTSQ